ncbi:uncharacterized protein LOC131070835 isoform X4 [Cryptomeria japonica]|uniref:uncharacterized protein LOC131070835 isoform X4 n=1 Tax=Cryptomeria japonica TaxID=3369 RepID=UPI0025AD2CA8|nr:uncharacterized protein LOC131070835 isoform X4 [Cryptomeria japonica]
MWCLIPCVHGALLGRNVWRKLWTRLRNIMILRCNGILSCWTLTFPRKELTSLSITERNLDRVLKAWLITWTRGNTLDSHRLIELAGRQGLDKQNAVVESLMVKCLTQEKCVSDREVLLNVAESAGIEGAEEWIDNPNAGLKEIQAEIEKYGHNISGVPHFKINDEYELAGAHAPHSFIRTFKRASQDSE